MTCTLLWPTSRGTRNSFLGASTARSSCSGCVVRNCARLSSGPRLTLYRSRTISRLDLRSAFGCFRRATLHVSHSNPAVVSWCVRSTAHQPSDGCPADSGKFLGQARAVDTQLFEFLDNSWVLTAGPQPDTCWVDFRVDFAFRSALYAQASSVFFDEVVRRMVAAFDNRCAHLASRRSDQLVEPSVTSPLVAPVAREAPVTLVAPRAPPVRATTRPDDSPSSPPPPPPQAAARTTATISPPGPSPPFRSDQSESLVRASPITVNASLAVTRDSRLRRPPPPLPDRNGPLW